MSLNLIDLIKGQMGPALVSQAASQLGESESGITKAISGLLPAVLGGIANHAEQLHVIDAVKNAASSGILSNLLGGTQNNSAITSLLNSIFGDRLGSLVSSVSSFAGISQDSTSSLLHMVTGATLGSIGKYSQENNLDASGVSNLLKDQKGLLTSLLPAGLSIASLGIGAEKWFDNAKDKLADAAAEVKDKLSDAAAEAKEKISEVKDKILDTALDAKENVEQKASEAKEKMAEAKDKVLNTASDAKENVEQKVSDAKEKATEMASNVKHNVEEKSEEFKKELQNNNGGGSVWKWLLPLILLCLAAYFFWKQRDKKNVESTTTVTTDSVNTATADSSATSSLKEKVAKVIDFNGISLNGYENGLEEQIIAFLKTDEYQNASNDEALKDKWFNFDNVNFKIGSTTELEEGSDAQLNNLVTILKAFPNVKIKIGGYTDKTGNEPNNVKLSQGRADFIKNFLTKAGIGSQVVSAEGYGSKYATQPESASNEERAIDRKMAIRFTK